MHHHCLLNTYSLKLLSGEKGKLLIHRSRKLYVKKQVGGKNRIKKKKRREKTFEFFSKPILSKRKKNKQKRKTWRKTEKKRKRATAFRERNETKE